MITLDGKMHPYITIRTFASDLRIHVGDALRGENLCMMKLLLVDPEKALENSPCEGSKISGPLFQLLEVNVNMA